MRIASLAKTAAALAVASLALTVQAQNYPNKPVKLVLGFTPGSAADVVARLLANELTTRFGQPDQFLKPRRSSGLDMQACSGPLQ